MGKVKVKCNGCGKEVERYPSQCLKTIYCSKECMRNYQAKNKIKYECEFCGKVVIKNKSDYIEKYHHFCSVECKNEYHKIHDCGTNNKFYGKHHSEETKKKISKSKTGKLTGKDSYNWNRQAIRCDYCGNKIEKIPYLIHRSCHHFCSVECHGKWKSENLVGENNPSWNHNKSIEDRQKERKYEEYYNWRKSVFIRDNYTCQCCGKCTGDLVAHHLDGYNWCINKRTDINNGVTLCTICHSDFHNFYGYGNNTREQLEEYIIDLINESTNAIGTLF